MMSDTEKRELIPLREGEEFIKLGQLLKKAGMVSSGVEAKLVIADGLVEVNGETEMRRGRKLKPKDVISFEGQTVEIADGIS